MKGSDRGTSYLSTRRRPVGTPSFRNTFAHLPRSTQDRNRIIHLLQNLFEHSEIDILSRVAQNPCVSQRRDCVQVRPLIALESGPPLFARLIAIPILLRPNHVIPSSNGVLFPKVDSLLFSRFRQGSQHTANSPRIVISLGHPSNMRGVV